MSDKNYYRNMGLSNRYKLNNDEIINKSNIIYEKIISIPEISKSKKILCYLSSLVKKEINTDNFISWAIKKQKKIYIPGTDWKAKEIKIYHLTEFPLLAYKFSVKFGINEPIPSYFEEFAGEDLDILILPGTAGDRTGIRYGYGKGFFDKLLGKLNKTNKKLLTIFPIFKCQLFSVIPHENHDVPVNIIVTENETIHCRPIICHSER
ncbi:5-formyltetrahydrofolate cyclo-ligase [Candidatus Poribacteria bacterium]|nr:5-formyltetrahydrofolate cyclo-ligase [Candidatus Poribacteria bacterium]